MKRFLILSIAAQMAGLAATGAATVEAHFTSASSVPVAATSYVAEGNEVNLSLGFAPPVGARLTVVKVTEASLVTGRFANLAHGQKVGLTYNATTYPFIANYYGGTGNDLVLEWAYRSPVAWGENGNYQLANNSSADSSVPVLVNTSGVLDGKTVMAVAAGNSHSLALCSDGTVAALGNNSEGQLGIGSTGSNSRPFAVNLSGVLAGKTLVAVSAGYRHSLALCSDGTVAAWGSNSYGLLGLDSLIERSTVPVEIAKSGALFGKTVVAISAGYDYSLALCSDGTVAAWGYNANGRLGNNSTTNSSVPVLVSTVGVLLGKSVVSVAAGDSHSLALCSDGTLAAWGANSSGQLGIGSTTSSSVPVEITQSGVLSGKTVVEVAAGSSNSLALCSDGTVAAWGSNTSGKLGNNSTANSSVPVLVNTFGVLVGKFVVSVAAGGTHSGALCSDGTVATWGYNSSGQLGDSTTASSTVPVAVSNSGVLEVRSVMAVSGGSAYVLTLAATPLSANTGLASVTMDANGLVPAYPSGTSDYAASVPAACASATVTPLVADPLASVAVNGVEIASGAASQPIPLAPGINTITLLVKAEDRSVTKSYNLSVLRPEPVDLVFDSPDAAALTVPAYNATGNTVTMRLNFPPETGARLTIIRVTAAPFIGEFANLGHGQKVGLDYDGTTYPFIVNYHGGYGNDLVLEWAYRSPAAWGSNVSGQLGNGTTTASSKPVAVSASGALVGKTVTAVSVGGSHSLAVCLDGSLASWGNNSQGQLGNGTTVSSNIPMPVTTSGVLAGRTVVAASASPSHSLALCSDGTVASWGANSSGQLGNNSTASRTIPVAVSLTGVLSGKTLVTIAAGGSHSLSLCSDGTVAAWGFNWHGQLGYGQLGNNANNSSEPVVVSQTGVLSGKTVVAIGAGVSHSLALCSDGTVTAWGRNDNGQLGNNSTTSSSVPVLVNQAGVLAGRTVVGVAAGDYHSLALCSDGTVAAWGHNSYGQLGNNSTTSSGVPVAVSFDGSFAGKTAVGIDAGSSHSLAVFRDGSLAAWGDISYGQLGDGTTTMSPVLVPVDMSAVPEGAKMMSAAAGGLHNLALVALPLSHDTGLEAISVGQSPIFPGIDPARTNYYAAVPTGISSITVTATASHPLAAMKISGVPTPSGTASQDIALSYGENTIDITVAAEDRSFTRTYTLTVLRPAPLVAVFPSPASPAVRFSGYDATGNTVQMALAHIPIAGTDLTLIDNTGLGFIRGRFANVAHGQTMTLSYQGRDYPFVADYFGGTGNDLVLHWAGRQLVAWGSNAAGQTGLGDVPDAWLPAGVPMAGVLQQKTPTRLAVGDYHTLALCTDGTVAAWGYNLFGQLGNNRTADRLVPVAVLANDVLAGKTVAAVAAGAVHSLALCSDGTVAAWGANDSGQLGNNGTTSCRIPVTVTSNGALAGKTVAGIAAGDSHSLALCADGTVVAWGDNYSGQLGKGGIGDVSRVPVAVAATGALAGKVVVAIAAGGFHSVALCTDGTVAAWGYNGYGQLGNGTRTDSSVPMAVDLSGLPPGTPVIGISAGQNHTLLLFAGGTVASCGGNASGQLGDGTIVDRSVPVAARGGALAGRSVTALSAGERHSLALCTDGTLAAWGANSEGQLGTNTAVPAATPVAVHSFALGFGTRITQLPAGATASHVLAISTSSAGGDDPYTQWLRGFLSDTEMNDPALSGPQADPAGDGIPNLVKYALGLPPLVDGSTEMPVAISSDGYLTLTFRKNKAATDVAYVVEAGDRLAPANWALASIIVSQTEMGGHWLVTVRDNVPMAGNPRRFMRLRVAR